ncbi:MAG: hypothetical protein Q8N35_03575 [Methylococcaceae bacterium]|nr:hypothetical protein [Methylococcaceae bacterium]MDZ4155693.1 hypothetical protein [Methylococcales bacterium]MDP2392172.1 hypothetical protein [Methylococcaceae bacterium]MDP3018642.1 hypothetical protein [Methylococcaceae bacterium]MDP3390573.1 hypothetical protein [Methylococcaceae bacterium]
MKLFIEIPNEQIAQKIVWFLEHLQHEGVKIIKTSETNSDTKTMYTDEYITEHWQELISTGLSSYDENYYKSDQNKKDRGAYLMEKHK